MHTFLTAETSSEPEPAFQAPRDDGGKLIWPPSDRAHRLLATNRQQLARSDYDVHGMPLVGLASTARRQLVAAAQTYTRSYRDVSTTSIDDQALPSLILAGHQPELFHPGVWLKNFQLDVVARVSGAAAVNLVVDSDTMKTSSLRVPGGTSARPIVEAVPYDRPASAIPFEDRPIVDRSLFRAFAGRVASRLAGLVPVPFVGNLWADVIERSDQTQQIGACIAQARHIWEGRWGTATLELPQSHVCSLPAFHHFAAHLLSHLPRLWEVYNAALFDYRRVNRIRSHAHPVPELAADADWLEAPFWVWRKDDPTRRRLFVRAVQSRVELSDRAGWKAELELSPDEPLDVAIDQLQTLTARGVRLRTRALITTMLARVLLGDLFIHGIGGAKYDQMTDVLIERFFGMQPPQYMVVSGTLRLPIDHQQGAPDELRTIKQTMRELTYHPERFIDLEQGQPLCECHQNVDPRRWLESKQRWVATTKTPANARMRHEAIAAANAALQPWVAERRDRLQQRIRSVEAQARAVAILTSREYGFCLYPEQRLREFLNGE